MERNVLSGDLVSKNTITSTALSVEVEFPTSNNAATEAALNYLLLAVPNVAHFVKIEWGKVGTGTYLMTLNTTNASAQGILIAGLSVSLMQIMDSTDAINVPEGYQVARMNFPASTATAVTITRMSGTSEMDVFVAGQIKTMQGSTGRTADFTLTEADFIYDDETGIYGVYIISSDKTPFQYLATGMTSPGNATIIK